MSREDWDGSYIVRLDEIRRTDFTGYKLYMGADGMSFSEQTEKTDFDYLSLDAQAQIRVGDFETGDVVEVGMEFETYTVMDIVPYELSTRELLKRIMRIEKHLGLI